MRYFKLIRQLFIVGSLLVFCYQEQTQLFSVCMNSGLLKWILNIKVLILQNQHCDFGSKLSKVLGGYLLFKTYFF